MLSAADIASEMDDGLRQLFQAGLELSLQVQADAMRAEAPRDRAHLAGAFHRLSRSVRQTAALRVKLAADVARADRESVDQAARAERERRGRRRTQVVQAVLAWAEHETPDAELEPLQDRLETALETEALYDDFLTEGLDAQVARIAGAFGIPAPTATGGSPPEPSASPPAPRRGDAVVPAALLFDAAPPPGTRLGPEPPGPTSG